MPIDPKVRRKLILRDLKKVLNPDEYVQIQDAPLEWITNMYPEIARFGAGYTALRNLISQWEIDTPRTNDYLDYLDYVLDAEKKELLGKEVWDRSFDALDDVLNFQKKKAPHYMNLANQRALTEVERAYFIISADPIIKRCLIALQIRHLIGKNNTHMWQVYNDNILFVQKTWGPVHSEDPIVPLVGFTNTHPKG